VFENIFFAKKTTSYPNGQLRDSSSLCLGSSPYLEIKDKFEFFSCDKRSSFSCLGVNDEGKKGLQLQVLINGDIFDPKKKKKRLF
jgi:hypothetical protein